MKKSSQELTGDYGYDLVHEESEPGRVDSAHKEPCPPPERTAELDGDYGYDEAHDFQRGRATSAGRDS